MKWTRSNDLNSVVTEMAFAWICVRPFADTTHRPCALATSDGVPASARTSAYHSDDLASFEILKKWPLISWVAQFSVVLRWNRWCWHDCIILMIVSESNYSIKISISSNLYFFFGFSEKSDCITSIGCTKLYCWGHWHWARRTIPRYTYIGRQMEVYTKKQFAIGYC